MAMELPDEVVSYQYQSLLAPAVEEWTPAAELRARHFLAAQRLKDLSPRLISKKPRKPTVLRSALSTAPRPSLESGL